MASTSRAVTAHRKPDVFVSFRGKDTRNNFTRHFIRDTESNGIFAFTDEELRGGDDISTTLDNMISESRVAVVVFSPNYANSRWCLNELVHIIQCKQQNGQTVLPVFLQGVEPTHVRHQTGLFGVGFQGTSCQHPGRKDVWIHALKQTADLSSGVFSHSYEDTIIDQLINGILGILGKMNSQDHEGDYFGTHRIEDVKSRLSSQGVSSIGIWGMGGSGKTTLARSVLAHISNNFDKTCFLENVRERAERGEFKRLKKDLFSQLLGPQHTIYHGEAAFVLSRIPVLIVLDDVTTADQIEAVIGDWRNYDSGSKLIATSRDKQVLANACDVTYEVQMLDGTDSLLLLQHHMLRQRQPNSKHMELLRQIIKYANGLPLALKLIGRRLYDKDITIWKSELEKLSSNPNFEIMKIMRTSFDGLDDMEKSIFLDIACLLHCSEGDCAEVALKACGYCPLSVIDRLVDKALLTINQNNKLQMHDLLRQMGDEIGKHSRIWRWEETANVLSKDMGTSHIRKTEVISSELPVGKRIKLKSNVFKEMRKLRILRLRNNHAGNILMPEGLKYLPNALRYLEWQNYPLPSLPRRFDPESLVELQMQDSNLSRLWSGKSYLPSLKRIDLSSSSNLRELPDLSGALKLEILEVKMCSKIKDIPSSVQYLVELKRLDFMYTGLTRCLELSRLEKLEHLSFFGCRKIAELPQLPKNIIDLDLSGTKIRELPRGIEHMYQLKSFWCQNCVELESLPSNIGKLEHLEELVITGCSNLRSLPSSFGDLRSLVKLTAHMSGLTCLPNEFGRLNNLHELNFSWSPSLESLPDGITGMAVLKELDFSNCTNLKRLPEDIRFFESLRRLQLFNCTSLEIIPELPCTLEELDASNCTSLVMYAPMSSPILGSKFSYNFLNCISLAEEARDNILRDFSIAVSELMQRLHLPYCPDVGLLVLPGSELPVEWFNESSSGVMGRRSSFLVNTTWRSVADPVVAFIFGVVLKTSFTPTTNIDSFENQLYVECQWQSEYGESIESIRRLDWHSESGRSRESIRHLLHPSRISAPREHVVLWLHFAHPYELCLPRTAFHFQIYGSNGHRGEHIARNDVEILKYGVSPFNVFY